MNKFKSLLVIIALSTLLCACSNANIANTDGAKPVTNNTTNDITETSKTVSSNLEAALGEWVCVAESYDGVIQIAEDNCLYSNITVYYEEDKYKADFTQSLEYSSLEIYGKTLTEVNEPLYKECTNQEWYADYKEKEGFCTESYKLTLLDSDTLEVFKTEIYNYEDEDPADNTYYTHYYFKKSDSDLESAIYQYRYSEEIEVSNVKDFYNALGSNRKIILKSGTYNFSELEDNDKNNEHVNWRYGYIYNDDEEEYWDYLYYNEQQAYCSNIQNLIIEGEEGAEVHICTEDSYVAPLAFENCDHITLKNLKIGHMVEPGYCTGSVVYLEVSRNIDIENCRLYGCGTYGIEAMNVTSLNVDSSDIYECSYGLVSLRDCYDINFDNCKLRNSKGFSMFDLNSCYTISFNNCVITENDATKYDNQIFIDATNCYEELTFDNCTFKDNIYSQFYAGEVKFINCNIQ